MLIKINIIIKNKINKNFLNILLEIIFIYLLTADMLTTTRIDIDKYINNIFYFFLY